MREKLYPQNYIDTTELIDKQIKENLNKDSST